MRKGGFTSAYLFWLYLDEVLCEIGRQPYGYWSGLRKTTMHTYAGDIVVFSQNFDFERCLQLLISKWQETLDHGEGTIVVALDIAGAYDRVWYKRLMVKFENIGVSGDVLRLIAQYLVNCKLQIVINGRCSKYHEIGASVTPGERAWASAVECIFQWLTPLSFAGPSLCGWSHIVFQLQTHLSSRFPVENELWTQHCSSMEQKMASKYYLWKDPTASYNETPASERLDPLTEWKVYVDHGAHLNHYIRGLNRP